MKELLELLHLLLCQSVHGKELTELLDRREGICYFYLECDIAEGQDMPDHQEWLERMEKFKIAMGFTTNEATLDFIRDCLKLSHEINRVTCGLEARTLFLKTILNI